MSTIGTGIAAGVANTTQQAKQAVQQRSAEQAQRADSEKSADKVKISQLQGAAATRDADQDMPDQAPPGYEDLYGHGDAEPPQDETAQDEAKTTSDVVDLIHRSDAPACSPTGLPLGAAYGPVQLKDSDATLFNHVDVKG
ncbi:hypothetical protein OT109_05635 [Phycisphaeraceae bacterium D3-23]